MELITWLNSNSAAIQTASTLAIAVLTGLYVRYTRQLLGSVRAESLEQMRPIIVFRFRYTTRKDGTQITQDRLVNMGKGPALRLALSSNLSVAENGPALSFKDNLAAWPHAIDNVLGPETGDPDLQICFCETVGRGQTLLRNERVKLRVMYEDIYGRKYATDFVNAKNHVRDPHDH